MIRKSESSQQSRPSNAETKKLYKRRRALETGPDADARRDRERRMNRECQQRFRDRRRALLQETVPDGDALRDRELIRETQRLPREAPSVARAPETDGPRGRSDLPLVEDNMTGVVFDKHPVVLPSHLHDKDAELERERNATRERMRRYRERLHVPLADLHSMDDVVDEDATPALPYLPLHQQQAIHDFLDRLVAVGNDLNECTVCLERYHGMSLHGSLCTRCHSEVMFSYVNIVDFSCRAYDVLF